MMRERAGSGMMGAPVDFVLIVGQMRCRSNAELLGDHPWQYSGVCYVEHMEGM